MRAVQECDDDVYALELSAGVIGNLELHPNRYRNRWIAHQHGISFPHLDEVRAYVSLRVDVIPHQVGAQDGGEQGDSNSRGPTEDDGEKQEGEQDRYWSNSL